MNESIPSSVRAPVSRSEPKISVHSRYALPAAPRPYCDEISTKLARYTNNETGSKVGQTTFEEGHLNE